MIRYIFFVPKFKLDGKAKKEIFYPGIVKFEFKYDHEVFYDKDKEINKRW